MKILVVGESCRDIYIYGECGRLCPEAPVPVFKSSGMGSNNGGMATNVFKNIKSISELNVDLITNQNWLSIKKTRYVDQRTNYLLLRVDENDQDYMSCDVSSIEYDKYDAIVISDYNKGYLSEKDIQYISENHTLTFLDTKKILGDWCRKVTFIKINNDEYKKTEHMLDEEIKSKIITTLGPKGAQYRGKIYPVPAVEIKDTSGAGDTFMAGLSVKFLETKDIDTAIDFANNCATFVVQRKGVCVA